jgi:uncharacterized phage protein gp47/JayE
VQLPLRNFAQLVSDAAASVQGGAKALVDLSVGSVLRAVLEANAAVALWLQWIAVQVLAASRAATSEGADLDAWMADFALARLPAVAAQGVVTFARYVPAATAFVPVGTLVRTADGQQGFLVQADPTNGAWDPVMLGYVLQAGVASMDVPVSCDTPGAAGNVQQFAVTLLASAIPGVDTVSNANDIGGGLDAEPDDALRARFRNWLASRSRATPLAVLTAVQSVQQGLQAVVLENSLPNGTPRMGTFTVVVDDGTGAPPAALLALVSQAVDAVRPAGSAFTVQPPAVATVAVQMTIVTVAGASHLAATQAVASAITSWINALPIGAMLPYARLTQLAFQASADVLNVGAVTLNGGTADIDPGPAGVVKINAIGVA